MKKQLRKVIILVGVVSSFYCVNSSLVKAETTITEMESITRSNETFETAEEIPLNCTVNGNFTDYSDEKNDVDIYKFTLPSTGTLELDLTSYVKATDVSLFDESGNEIQRKNYIKWDDSVKLLHTTFKYDLKKGTYYLRLANSQSRLYFDKYFFHLNFVSSNVNNNELNNEFSSAESIDFTKKYFGQISIGDLQDFYKFKVEENGTFQLIGNNKNEIYVNLYSISGDSIRKIRIRVNQSIGQGTFNETFSLEKGEYILLFESKYTGAYNFTLNSNMSKITLNKKSLVLKKGKTFQLKTSIAPTTASNKNVTWKSSNKSVVTVSSNGKVTAKKKGTAYVSCTAKDGGGATTKIKITVK